VYIKNQNNMASNFLENLKKSVEEGDFNSEAAKKINEIDRLADEKFVKTKDGTKYVTTGELDKMIEKAGVKSVTEEEAAALNSDYEKKMADIKKQDAINKQLATLIEIEEMVKMSIDDMFSFMDELEAKFEKEFEDEDPMYGELSQKIDNITSKYNSIINN
jgi:hypothetical protein